MPGVLKTDCRVKPEVKSFTRLGPTSRVAQYLLARNFDPSDQNALKMEPSCTGGGNVTTEEGS